MYDNWHKEFVTNFSHYMKIFNDNMNENYETGIEKLENDISSFNGRKYCVAVASATDALKFSLLAHNVGPGDEVLVSNFSWISSSSCISMVGATPVFCDIDLNSYHITLKEIQKMYSPKVKALIYTHLFGNMTDTAEIEKFCKEKNIVFIEDSAQSLGSSLNGRKAGTIGNCSSYSFNSNKVIAGINGGGIFMTDEESKAEYVKGLRRHGKISDFEFVGYNSKPYRLNTEIISFRLSHWRSWQDKRQEIAKIYNDELNSLPIVMDKAYDPNLDHNYHKYVIRFEDQETRDWVIQALREFDIRLQIHYDKPLSKNSLYNNIKYRKSKGKNAEIASNTVLSLPINPWLTESEVKNICSTIQTIL